MDPNATLAELRDRLDKIDTEELTELAESLLAWLSGGGFAPAGYEPRRVELFYALTGLINGLNAVNEAGTFLMLSPDRN